MRRMVAAVLLTGLLIAPSSAGPSSSPMDVNCQQPDPAKWSSTGDITLGFSPEGPRPLTVSRYVWESTRPNRVSFNIVYGYRQAEATTPEFLLFVAGAVEIPKDVAMLRVDSTLCHAGVREAYSFSSLYQVPLSQERPLIDLARPLARSYVEWLRSLGATASGEVLTPQIGVEVAQSFIGPGQRIPQMFPLGIVDRPVKLAEWKKTVNSFVLVPPR